jgi:hypothetical protein
MSQLQKRKTPPTEATESTAAKRPRRGQATKRSSSDNIKTEYKGGNMGYTPDQRHWIRLHHYLLRRAVMDRSLGKAPPGRLSCAYFNAYWQGSVLANGSSEVPDTRNEPRTFQDFDDTRRVLLPNIIGEIETSMGEADSEAIEFIPVIEGPALAEYRNIFNRHKVRSGFNWADEAGVTELNNFLDTIIDRQLARPRSTWRQAGRRNLLSRETLNLRGYTTQFRLLQPLRDGVSVEGMRADWHLDSCRRRDPKDFLRAFNPAKAQEENIRMTYRKLDADAGNALLNVAILRPQGYEGPLKSLVTDPEAIGRLDMTPKQRKKLVRQMRNVQTGNELRAQIFREAEASWPQSKDEEVENVGGVQTVGDVQTVDDVETAGAEEGAEAVNAVQSEEVFETEE